VLQLDDLRLRQGDFRLTANWTLAEGDRLALIGPSGAGKSTLLAAIAGFLRPDSGALRWNGANLTAEPPARRPVAMLFQDQNLFPHLSILRNVGLGIRPDLRLNAAQRAQALAALERVGLGGMAERLPGSLSGGQQSRAALARVLVQDRPLLLLDEPVSALGPALRAEMLDLVTALLDETGSTLIMVSHAPEDARRIGGLLSLVDEGHAAAPVPGGEAFANPSPGLRRYLG